MSDITFFLILCSACLLAMLAVAVSEIRYYKRRFHDERDTTHRLIGHLSRIQSERPANILPFVRGRK